MHVPELAELDPNTVEGYRDIMQGLAKPDHTLPLRTMVNRLLTRADIATAPAPHMGMALDCYTNCTSPLRKYVDFLVQRQIKAALNGAEPKIVDLPTIDALKTRLAASRVATREAERWLTSKYLSKLASAEETVIFKATISHVTSSGFTARLDDNGLEGFVDLRKDQEKFSYDKWMASLTSTTRRFQLGEPVELHFIGIGGQTLYQALFQPLATCGLKSTVSKS